MEQHRPGNAMHSQIAMNVGSAFAGTIDRYALERNAGKFLSIKELRGE